MAYHHSSVWLIPWLARWLGWHERTWCLAKQAVFERWGAALDERARARGPRKAASQDSARALCVGSLDDHKPIFLPCEPSLAEVSAPRRRQRPGRPRRRWGQAWVHLAGETCWRNAEAWPNNVAAERPRLARVARGVALLLATNRIMEGCGSWVVEISSISVCGRFWCSFWMYRAGPLGRARLGVWGSALGGVCF